MSIISVVDFDFQFWSNDKLWSLTISYSKKVAMTCSISLVLTPVNYDCNMVSIRWLNPYIWKSYRSTLDDADIYSIMPSYSAKHLSGELEQ